ncbi:MAG TPA: hypothetical protein VEW69_07505 [Alphaproteobacteria bacterium]|nr:hypothetical protein [Alphaproteobacteria bacterium]
MKTRARFVILTELLVWSFALSTAVLGQNSGRILLSRYPQASYPTLGAKITQALRDCQAAGGSCELDALDQTGDQDLGAFDPGPSSLGVTLYLGRGTYSTDSITLRTGMRIIGLNESRTVIQAKKSTTDLIVMPPGGPVINIEISNLKLSGVTSVPQRAFYLNAQRSGPPAYHGGLWFSQFRNLHIVNFTGDIISIRGSQDGWWGPLQWITWEHVIAWQQDPSHNALRIVGMTGQMRFVNCAFDNISSSSGKAPRPGVGVFIGQDEHAKAWPISIQFDLASVQGWGKGVVVSHADNIHFITPHMEGDDDMFDIIRGSRNFVAEAGLAWTNACQSTDKSGYCFFIDGVSNATFRDFTICCKPDKIVKAVVGARGVISNNTSWETPSLPDDPVLGEELVMKGQSSPSGRCANGQMYVNAAGGQGSTFYVCEGEKWKSK